MQKDGKETDSFFPFYQKIFFPLGIDLLPPQSPFFCHTFQNLLSIHFLHRAWGIGHQAWGMMVCILQQTLKVFQTKLSAAFSINYLRP